VTYEPGTADILTTCDPPFPPDEDDSKLVARAVLRALNSTRKAYLVQYGYGPWRIVADGLTLRADEFEALRRLMAR
jgi:hypothetical protein